MSWHFSQALVAEYLAATCSDGGQSAPSNTTPMPAAFYWPDKTTEHSRLSRFGMTSEPLTENHGKELLTWFLVAFHAKTFPQPGRVLESMESEADYGPKWHGSFARYSLDSSLWKTAQFSLVEGLDEFSETWPRWGSMRNGVSYLRPTPALPICESASGLWQTLTADDAMDRKAGKWNSRGEPKLSAQVMLVPTLCARDFRYPGKSRMERTGSKSGDVLPQIVGGPLNPDWCEWFMGWPIGWTELKPLETAKFREWQRQHSIFSPVSEVA